MLISIWLRKQNVIKIIIEDDFAIFATPEF